MNPLWLGCPLWLVYTDDAGVVETAGVYSTAEKASVVAREATDATGLAWVVRMLPAVDSNWEI
jgi:hypothetical protein